MYSPTLPEFLKLAAQGNVIPVTRRLLADIETPLSAYRKIRGPGESFLFESIEGGEHLGRYSFVGCNPRAIIRQQRDHVQVLENGKVIEEFRIRPPTSAGDPTVAAGSELDIIAAVVIGGGSLSGGEGSILGSMIGALIMAFLRNGCQQVGWPNYIQEIIIGAIIVVAVAIDRWRSDRVGR